MEGGSDDRALTNVPDPSSEACATAWQSFDLLSSALDATKDIVSIKDDTLTLRFVNAAFCRAVGRTPADVVGHTDADLFPEETAAAFEQDDRTVLKTGRSIARDQLVPARRGLLWVNARKDPVVRGGRRIGVMTVVRDISDRIETERDLRRTTGLLDRFFSQSVFAVAYLDRRFNFLRVNDAYARSGCRAAKDFIGRNHFDLYPNAENEALFRRVLRTGEPYAETARPFAYPDQPERGTTYWDLSVQPVRDAAGVIDGLILTLVDATEREHAVRALRESEARYRLLAENATDVITTHDLHGRRTFVSPACRTVLGYEPESLLGDGPVDLVHPDDAARLLKLQTRILGEEIAGQFRYRLRHRDGHDIWVETTSRAVRDPATGAVTGLIAVTRDVGDQVREEEALRRSRLLYKGLFDGSSAPMLLLDPEDGRIVQANDAAAGFYGLPVATLRRMSIQDINTALPEAVAALRKRAAAGEQSRFQARHRLASGEVRDVLVHSTPLILEGRTVLFSIVHDVTDRVRAEAALRDREATLHALFESTEDLICVRGRDGGLITFNSAFRRFVPRYFRVEATAGLRTMDLLPPDERTRWDTVLSHVLDGAVYREQFPMTVRGHRRWYDMALTPVVHDGVTLGTAEISRDITELKEAEAALARSESEKALILGSISDLVVFYEQPDMCISWTNAASAASLGVPIEDLIGQTCHTLWADPKAPCDGCPVLETFRTRAPAEAQTTTTDGRVWSVRAFPALDDRGALKGVVEIARDVSALALSEQKFEKAFMNNATLMAITEPETGRIVEANTAFLQALGLDRDAVIGHTSVDLGLFPTYAVRRHVVQDLLSPDGATSHEVRFTAADGQPVIGELTVERLDSGRHDLLLAMITDVTQQRDLMAQLEHKATHDVMTGAFNRQHADRILDQEARRADRMGTDVALIMADIDHFKAVNDRFGHPVGDTVLREVVQRLGDRIRETDLLARWGGEEFLVILPGTDRAGAAQLAETLRRAMADAPVPQVGPVTISLGVAARRSGESVAEWVVRVDDALYEAKETGRDRVCLA